MVITDGIMREAPAVFAKELPPSCPVDAAALARQIELRSTLAPGLGKLQRSDTLFSTFNYTGEGSGGGEVEASPEALAYSDDALLYLRKVPPLLRGARLIRTASKDNIYWANDYIVATTACPLTLFVAHDPRAPKPSWLDAYQRTSDDVMVNTQRLQLYALNLAKDATVRIPGNTDQGKANSSALNLILFAALAKPEPRVGQK